jgi:hypothetical protein
MVLVLCYYYAIVDTCIMPHLDNNIMLRNCCLNLINIWDLKNWIGLRLMWHVLLAQVWTRYKTGKLNMWTLFCNVYINFLNSQIWKEIMLELNRYPTNVTTFSSDFSFQNLVFWNLFEFSVAEITWNQYLPHSESKSYQINSVKSCSSRSFHQTPKALSNSS